MSGNYPDHVSYRDFDYSTATCPTCKGETDNFGPHHCDEDCRRGCRLQQAEDCDDCASACIGCGEKGCKKDRGVCQACKDNAAEFDIPHLLNCEVKLKAAEAEVARLAAQVQRAGVREAQPDTRKWQPIETAPRKTEILLAWHDGTKWHQDTGWVEDWEPDLSPEQMRWMPLPSLPALRAQQEGK